MSNAASWKSTHLQRALLERSATLSHTARAILAIFDGTVMQPGELLAVASNLPSSCPASQVAQQLLAERGYPYIKVSSTFKASTTRLYTKASPWQSPDLTDHLQIWPDPDHGSQWCNKPESRNRCVMHLDGHQGPVYCCAVNGSLLARYVSGTYVLCSRGLYIIEFVYWYECGDYKFCRKMVLLRCLTSRL